MPEKAAPRKREPPVSWRPPKHLEKEFSRRLQMSGMGKSEYITSVMSQVFDLPPPRAKKTPKVNIKEIALLLHEMGRIRSEFSKIGSNMNQIAKAANLDRYLRSLHEAALAELQAAIADLTEIRAASMEALGKEI